MGFGFNYTWLSLHGYLTFSNSPQQFPEYPLIFPIQVRAVLVRVIVMIVCPGLAAGGGPLHHRPLLLPLQDRGAQRQRGRRRPGRARQQEARGLLQVSRKILFYPIQHLLNLYVTHQFVFEAKLTEKNIFNSGNRYLENSNIICINQNPGARTLDMSGWSGTCTRGRTSWGSRSGRGPSGTSGSPWSAPRPSSPSTSSSPHGKMSHLPAAFPSQDGR